MAEIYREIKNIGLVEKVVPYRKRVTDDEELNRVQKPTHQISKLVTGERSQFQIKQLIYLSDNEETTTKGRIYVDAGAYPREYDKLVEFLDELEMQISTKIVAVIK